MKLLETVSRSQLGGPTRIVGARMMSIPLRFIRQSEVALDGILEVSEPFGLHLNFNAAGIEN